MKKSLSYTAVLLALLISHVCRRAQLRIQTPSTANHIPSQVDIFAGYSYWMPNTTLERSHFSNDNKGLIVSGTYYLNPTFGLELVGDWHLENADDSMRSLSIGPIFRRRLGLGLTPFVHTLIGAADISGPPYRLENTVTSTCQRGGSTNHFGRRPGLSAAVFSSSSWRAGSSRLSIRSHQLRTRRRESQLQLGPIQCRRRLAFGYDRTSCSTVLFLHRQPRRNLPRRPAHNHGRRCERGG